MSILLVSFGISLSKAEEKVQEREEKADFHSEQSKYLAKYGKHMPKQHVPFTDYLDSKVLIIQ